MNVTIKIQKRTTSEWFISGIVAIVFLWGTLFDLLNLPSIAKYIVDLMWCVLLLMLLVNKRSTAMQKTKKLIWIVLALGFVTIIGFVANLYSPLYYLWGIRNNFRFFVFFFGCVMFLREKSAEKMLIWFEKLVYVNFVVSCVQFFLLGYEQDHLGGIFGVSAGCNGKLVVFLGIITALSAIKYLNGNKTLLSFSVECLLNLIVAAMAELKFYYILFVFIIAAATLITKFTYKKLIIIVVCILGFVGGTSLLIRFFPKFAETFAIDELLKVATSASGYTGKGGLNRLTSLPIISRMFLNTAWKSLFGLGLGHCDTAAFSFLNTPFFQRYGYLHYNFFSSAFMYLETGILGLTTYCGFFVVVYLITKKREKMNLCNKEWGQLARIGAMLSLIFVIYNSSMRAEEAYLVYFILSLPFVGAGPKKCKTVT